jgi:hypothetical protein
MIYLVVDWVLRAVSCFDLFVLLCLIGSCFLISLRNQSTVEKNVNFTGFFAKCSKQVIRLSQQMQLVDVKHLLCSINSA